MLLKKLQAQILKHMGNPMMTNLYYGTVKQLLERISRSWPITYSYFICCFAIGVLEPNQAKGYMVLSIFM